MKDLEITQIEKIYYPFEKDNLLAEWMNIELTEDGNQYLTNTKEVWMPRHDMNQLFRIVDQFIEYGYKFFITNNKCEVSYNNELIIVNEGRFMKSILHETLFQIVKSKLNK